MENRLKALRQAKNLTLKELADLVGTTHQQIMRLESGDRKLSPQWLERLAKPLGVRPTDIIADELREDGALWVPQLSPRQRVMITNYDAVIDRARSAAGVRDPLSGLLTPIPEIDVRGGMGGGGEEAPTVAVTDEHGNTTLADDVSAIWGLPERYVRGDLGLSPDDLRIIEAEGDSMFPTIWSGDRVGINVRDRNPTPPGIFALWDGFGVLIKRLERILGSDPPTVKIISDNDKHQPVAMTADEVHIIGRVRWIARRV